jgi:hypothetical protein
MLMVQASVAQGNFKNAHKILEDVRENGTEFSCLMDIESIQRIYKEAGSVYTPPEKQAGDDEYDIVRPALLFGLPGQSGRICLYDGALPGIGHVKIGCLSNWK